MRRIVLFCALGLLGGCRTADPLTSEVITLFCSTSEPSKTAALSAGDEVGLFAAVEGTEDYFMENAKWVVGSDGHTLATSPAAYYPQERQAIRFYAYFPYHTGDFSVPTDQSTAAALKQADLCWATAGSTPVATPVSLEFEHVLARLVVQTNQTPTQLAVPNAVTGGVLHIATGEWVLGTTRSELNTTGSELILPAQPLTRLLLTVSGVVYVYEGAIPLETGKTTTLNLTLNPSTKTATLSGSSITAWGAATATGNPTQAVSNTLTLHWPYATAQSATANKIVFHIKDHTTNTTADYTVSSGITHTNQTFTVPFGSATLHYPYLITEVSFYNGSTALHPETCKMLLGSTIYKSGASTVGIKDVVNTVRIGNLWWATGNLVATNATAGKAGVGGCKIGAPADGGLYFQFGSLIGYKGGALANGGTGVGFAAASMNGSCWGGATAYSWANDAMVWPEELVGAKTVWIDKSAVDVSTLNDYYFNYSVVPWETVGKDIRAFNVSISGDSGSGNLGSGRYAKKGVGDPCTYYLGAPWRLPSSDEYKAMCNNQGGYGAIQSWSSCNASWTLSPVNGGNFVGNKLFLPASGHRAVAAGGLQYITMSGYGWSSSAYNAATGCYLDLNSVQLTPQSVYNRSIGFPVRCVQSAS